MKTLKKILITILIISALFLIKWHVDMLNKEINSLKEENNIKILENQSLNDDIFMKNNQLEKQMGEIENLKNTLEDKDIEIYNLNQKLHKIKKQQEEKMTSRGSSRKIFNMEATYYTAFCPTGCIGITTTGYNVKNTIYYEGMRIVAVDPKVIPLHSILKIDIGEESFKAIALDTGGKIKNYKVDILVASRSEAYKNGRHNVTVTILEEGKK